MITTKTRRRPDGVPVAAPAAGFDVRLLVRQAAPALLVLGAWIACRPYAGIVHDARLYVAQALHALNPDIFARDLFFAFGSQDDFTIFTRLFAPLVEQFGPSIAAMLLVAVGHAMWLSGAAALALRLAPHREAAIAGLVLLAAMPGDYGGWGVFAFGESIATPRLFAESLSLWALWGLTHGRLAASAGLVIVGGLLHPLVGATALGVGFLFLALRDRRWLLPGLAGAAAIGFAAYAGVAPFDRLAQTMDPEWLAIVEQRNAYLFPASWTARDWSWLVLAAAATASGVAMSSGWQRHLALAVMLAGLAGLLATYVGADIWRNLFVIQTQPYRTLWLLHVFAYLLAGTLFVRLWRLQEDGHALIALIVLSWLTALSLHAAAGMAVGTLAFALAVLRLRGALAPLPTPIQTGSVMLAGILVGFLIVARVVTVAKWQASVSGEAPLRDVLDAVTVIEIAAVAALAVGFVRLLPRAARAALPALALLLVAGAAAGWDRRDAWSRAQTEHYPVEVLDASLASDARIYWEGDVRGAWLVLRRPSYVSATQGAGIAFERRTALAFRDRTRVVQPLTGGELVDLYRTSEAAPSPLPALTRRMLVAACRRDGDLDAMVLSRAVPGAYAAEWVLPTPIHDWNAIRAGFSRPPTKRLYLYRCADLS